MDAQKPKIVGEWADPFLLFPVPYEVPEDNRITRPSDRFYGTGHASIADYQGVGSRNMKRVS